MDERNFVKKLLEKDKKTTRQFYKLYKRRLFSFIRRKIANSKDAEEILQDTFVSALDSLPLFSFRSSLFTWLCGIAYHETIDFLRRKRIKIIVFSHFPFLEKLVNQALGPELALQEKEAKQRIGQTFKNISEGYNQILRLKYIEGLSVAEIAKRLGKTAKAIESKLGRARLAFQKEYAKNAEFKTQKLFKDNWQIFNSSFN